MPAKNRVKDCRLTGALIATLVFNLFVFAADVAAQEQILLEERQSLYSNIFIFEKGDEILMNFSHNDKWSFQSRGNRFDELAIPLSYSRFFTVAPIYAQSHRRMLMIGLGGGRASWYLHKHMPNLAVTVVELDPAVIELAEKYFFVHPAKNYDIRISDGRAFLMKDKTSYDIIVLDAHRGPYIPFHLLTLEFYKLVKAHLSPGGVVIQNVDPKAALFDAAVTTMAQVFEHFDYYPADGNTIIVAYNGLEKRAGDLAEAAKRLQFEFRFKYPLPDLLRQRQDSVAVEEAKVLTDDFAPVNALSAIENHNRRTGSK